MSSSLLLIPSFELTFPPKGWLEDQDAEDPDALKTFLVYLDEQGVPSILTDLDLTPLIEDYT